jgi:hypothetical protein
VSISTSPAVRCPRCSAHVRTGSDWCTLCYADLRPAPQATAAEPVAEPAVETAAETVVEPPVLLEAPAEAMSPRTGKHARRTPVEGHEPIDAAASPGSPDVEALAARMLAELSVSQPKSPLGPLAASFDTPAKKAGLMVGGTLAVICLLFILMAVAGTLL